MSIRWLRTGMNTEVLESSDGFIWSIPGLIAKRLIFPEAGMLTPPPPIIEELNLYARSII